MSLSELFKLSPGHDKLDISQLSAGLLGPRNSLMPGPRPVVVNTRGCHTETQLENEIIIFFDWRDGFFMCVGSSFRWTVRKFGLMARKREHGNLYCFDVTMIFLVGRIFVVTIWIGKKWFFFFTLVDYNILIISQSTINTCFDHHCQLPVLLINKFSFTKFNRNINTSTQIGLIYYLT